MSGRAVACLKQLAELKKKPKMSESTPKHEVPVYTFATITFKDLEQIVSIKRNISTSIFKSWFNANLNLLQEDRIFLENLIADNYFLINSYNEEELKIKFISPVLNRVKFTDIEHDIRDFYEEKIPGPLRHRSV